MTKSIYSYFWSAPLLISQAIAAAELQVPEQFPSVAAAASASQPGDIISIAPGVYRIGLLALPSHNLTIHGRGNRSDTVLTGAGLLLAPTSASRSIAKLTMRSCTEYGAIEIRGCSAIITDVDFDQCIHGVFLRDGGAVSTNGCMFRNGVRGGYAYTSSQWNATDCVFLNNNCTGAYGGGAAFHVGSGGAFSRCVFLGNRAAAGGAIGLSFGGSRSFSDCYFEDNQSIDGPVWWTEFGASGTLLNSILCGHDQSDLVGSWANGGGNVFVPEGCADCNADGKADRGQILLGELFDDDANGVPDICEVDPCPGDITNGGTVDATDLSIVLAAWGTNGQGEFQADIDNSGLVDGGDLALVLGGWGPCPQ